MSLSPESQNLSAHQISSTYLNPLLRYDYFRFGKTNVRRTGILLPFAILTRSHKFVCHSESSSQISPKSGHPRRSNDVVCNFKMATAVAQYYFRFRVSCRYTLPKFKIYLQTRFHRHNLNLQLRYNYDAGS